MSLSSKRTRIAAGLVLVAALVAGSTAVGPAQTATAACKPSVKTSKTLIAGTYYYDFSASACTLRVLHDKYGEKSGYLGVGALLLGWVKTPVTQAVAGYLGTMSSALFFTQGIVSKCTANFTKGATLTFVRGSIIGCKS